MMENMGLKVVGTQLRNPGVGHALTKLTQCQGDSRVVGHLPWMWPT